MNTVTMEFFFAYMAKHQHTVHEETDNECSYYSYMSPDGREIGYIEFHSDDNGPLPETYHIWEYGI